jgi:hypothetical protein
MCIYNKDKEWRGELYVYGKSTTKAKEIDLQTTEITWTSMCNESKKLYSRLS